MKPRTPQEDYIAWMKALPVLWAAGFEQCSDDARWVFRDLKTGGKHDLSAADISKIEDIRRRNLFQVS